VLCHVALVHLFRREGQDAHAQAEASLTLAHEHGFAFWSAWGTSLQGWALVERAALSGAREQGEAGLMQIREGLAALRATGAEVWVPLLLGALAQAYAQGGQAKAGLRVVAEALAVVEKNEERWHEAELYRLAGELSLRIGEPESGRIGDVENEAENRREGFSFADSPFRRFSVSSPEECFQKAIEIARRQEAKSLELRAATSLARLWQQQGKHKEAHSMLSEIYGWFTEGFETKDLQDAKALLAELGEER